MANQIRPHKVKEIEAREFDCINVSGMGAKTGPFFCKHKEDMMVVSSDAKTPVEELNQGLICQKFGEDYACALSIDSTFGPTEQDMKAYNSIFPHKKTPPPTRECPEIHKFKHCYSGFNADEHKHCIWTCNKDTCGTRYKPTVTEQYKVCRLGGDHCVYDRID